MAKISAEIHNAMTLLEKFAMKFCGKPTEIVGTQEKKVLFGLLGTQQAPIEKVRWRVEADTFTLISQKGAEVMQLAILTFPQAKAARLQISVVANQYRLSILKPKPLPPELQKLVEAGHIAAVGTIPTQTVADKLTALDTKQLWFALHDFLQKGIISIDDCCFNLQSVPEVA